MASCEKCWSDAYTKSMCNPYKSQAEIYSELIIERKDDPCTPEQQAGPDANECPKCNKKAVHQLINVCMNCGHVNPNK